MKLLFLGAIVSITPSLAAAVVRADAPPPARDSTPGVETARSELTRADDLRRALRGKTGDERATGRRAAIDAYRGVRARFPDDVALCVESAFRAGELLRAAGDGAGARAEFEFVRAKGDGTPFRVRALFELGQIARRAKDARAALEAFEAVIADKDASQRQKDDASLWAGRVQADLERFDDARRTWQRVADTAEDPLDRVRAWDWIALLLVDAKDLEGAAGALERCRDALSEIAAEETKIGERVRHALTAMRAHDDLARAIAERAAKQTTSSTDAPRR